jgi:hypothetical protein
MIKVLGLYKLMSRRAPTGLFMKKLRLLIFNVQISIMILAISGCLFQEGVSLQKRFKPTGFKPENRGVVYRKRGADYDGVIRFECFFFNKEGKLLLSIDRSDCALDSQNGNVILSENNFLKTRKLSGELIWEIPLFTHHDLFFSKKMKTIATVLRKKYLYKKNEIWYDSVNLYHADGRLLSSWNTFDKEKDLQKVLGITRDQLEARHYLDDKNRRIGTKINSASLIENHPYKHKDKSFQDGNVLISLNQLSLIIIVEPKSGDIVWSFKLSDKLGYGVHSIRQLKDGNFLFFENRASYDGEEVRHFSMPQVVKFNPILKKRIWRYPQDKNNTFYSIDGCSVFEMPNGHLLISYEKNKSVVEITREGEIVWEWFPELTVETGDRAEVMNVESLSWQEFREFLEKSKQFKN